MLFGRFNNTNTNTADSSDIVSGQQQQQQQQPLLRDEVWPAFQRYLKVYVDLVTNNDNNDNTRQIAKTESGSVASSLPSSVSLRHQKAFDEYFAEHDRAKYMLQAKFGKEWTDAFVHDFMFDLSR